jgi:hypothetical protein
VLALVVVVVVVVELALGPGMSYCVTVAARFTTPMLVGAAVVGKAVGVVEKAGMEVVLGSAG